MLLAANNHTPPPSSAMQCICVFVYLCICVFVYLYILSGPNGPLNFQSIYIYKFVFYVQCSIIVYRWEGGSSVPNKIILGSAQYIGTSTSTVPCVLCCTQTIDFNQKERPARHEVFIYSHLSYICIIFLNSLIFLH